VNPDSTAFFVLVGFEVTVAKLALHHRISAERFLTASAYTSPQPNKDRFLSVVLPKTMGAREGVASQTGSIRACVRGHTEEARVEG